MLTKLKDLRNVSVPTMYTKVSSAKLCLLCLCPLFNYLFVDVCVVLRCGIDHVICIIFVFLYVCLEGMHMLHRKMLPAVYLAWFLSDFCPVLIKNMSVIRLYLTTSRIWPLLPLKRQNLDFVFSLSSTSWSGWNYTLRI